MDSLICNSIGPILGGPHGQVDLGCRFPADPAYRRQLQPLGLIMGKDLAQEGVLERYAVDLIAVPQTTPQGSTGFLHTIEMN